MSAGRFPSGRAVKFLSWSGALSARCHLPRGSVAGRPNATAAFTRRYSTCRSTFPKPELITRNMRLGHPHCSRPNQPCVQTNLVFNLHLTRRRLRGAGASVDYSTPCPVRSLDSSRGLARWLPALILLMRLKEMQYLRLKRLQLLKPLQPNQPRLQVSILAFRPFFLDPVAHEAQRPSNSCMKTGTSIKPMT